MDEIFATLLQTIQENAFPLFYANAAYRREQHQILQQIQQLEVHLNDEEKAQWEALRQAELRAAQPESDAEVRLALAVGVRLALPK